MHREVWTLDADPAYLNASEPVSMVELSPLSIQHDASTAMIEV